MPTPAPAPVRIRSHNHRRRRHVYRGRWGRSRVRVRVRIRVDGTTTQQQPGKGETDDPSHSSTPPWSSSYPVGRTRRRHYLPAAMLLATLLPEPLVMLLALLPPPSPRGGPRRRSFAPHVPPLVGRVPVVADRDGENGTGYELRREGYPGSVVPAAHVPAAIGKDVVLSPVEEIVGADARCVHDRRRGHGHERRRRGEIDPDIHPHLGLRGAGRAHDGDQHNGADDHSSKHHSALPEPFGLTARCHRTGMAPSGQPDYLPCKTAGVCRSFT